MSRGSKTECAFLTLIVNREIATLFTPLESPGIYAGDVINRKHQLLVKAGLKLHLSNGVCSLAGMLVTSKAFLSHHRGIDRNV
jgi:hypothetical protein